MHIIRLIYMSAWSENMEHTERERMHEPSYLFIIKSTIWASLCVVSVTSYFRLADIIRSFSCFLSVAK